MAIVVEVTTAKAKQQIDNLKTSIDGIDITSKKGQKSIDGLDNSIDKLGTSSSKSQSEINRLKDSLKGGLGADLSNKRLREMDSLLRNNGFDVASNSAKQFTNQLQQLRNIAATIGLGMLVKDVIMTGAAFEQSIKTAGGVMGIMPGQAKESSKAFQELTDIARKMGAETEWSASQAAEALQFLGMAGFNATQSVKALPGVLDLATAGQIDLASAADIASNAMTAMGLGVHELGRVNDTFVATITRSNVSIPQMADSFKYAAPSAKGFGYEIEQLNAMIGVLGNAGLQGSVAGTSLAQSFMRTSAVAKKLGMEDGATLVQVLEKIKEKQWDTNQVMSAFGVEAGKAALVLKENMGTYHELAEANFNAKNEAKALADVMRGTVSGALKELNSVLESVKIDIFSEYEDDIKKAIKDTTKWIQDHKDEILKLVDVMLKLGKIGGELLVMYGGFKILAVVAGGFNVLTAAINGSAAAQKVFCR